MNIIRSIIFYFNLFCMGYTLLLYSIYLVQLVVSFVRINKENKENHSNDYEKYFDSDNLLPISILVPAHNESENIVHNVTELLKINYPSYELIVVNDGSTDSTAENVITAFSMKKVEYSFKQSIETKEIKGVYYNPKYPKLIFVDKENGGKSDALNAGINVSSYPLFACLDADSRVERNALLRLATEFIKNTKTVVAGGLVRIANGTTIEDGEWKDFKMPESGVERFQIVEYFRSFLSGRVSFGATNSLLIVSGAFGLFKKQTVIDVGGYRTDTVGEDMEIVVKIHEHLRKMKKKYAIIFCYDAVCWTQGPMSMHDLRVQRRRWQVGLMDTLIHYKRMIFNPRYGVAGMFSIPYSWLFELFGAAVEVMGYFIIPFSLLMGELSILFFILYFLLASGLGIILSLGSLILEQNTHKCAMNNSQTMKLALYAVLENFGYRQYITVCRFDGMLRFRKFRGNWGKIQRKEFNK